MGLKDILNKLRPQEETVEFPEEEESKEKVTVRVEKLNGIEDVERISRMLREGNILFLKTKELQKNDLGQFQNSVHKLKRTCDQFGWDIAGTEDGYLVLTPQFAKIERVQ